MNQTSCHSYFDICSTGTIQNEIGFVAAENSCFDPDYITENLESNPSGRLKWAHQERMDMGIIPFPTGLAVGKMSLRWMPKNNAEKLYVSCVP